MIRNNKLLIAAGTAALSAGIYTSAVSAASVTANASATVVQGLTISEDNGGMNFGDVSESGAGTVVLTPAGARSTTGGADVLAGGGEQAGQYTITGADGKAYTLTLPTVPVVITETVGSVATMTVDTFQQTGSTGTAAAAGETMNVGATLNISAGQLVGTYTGSYAITVNYD
ncbi:MAG: DUF4402 domain-containing protein [Gammaproteobacteria bacterium]|nr:DUF4402 domain-containing protein [Gammaproteobacteria bacterium]